jgi:hypothetical protein
MYEAVVDKEPVFEEIVQAPFARCGRVGRGRGGGVGRGTGYGVEGCAGAPVVWGEVEVVPDL